MSAQRLDDSMGDRDPESQQQPESEPHADSDSLARSGMTDSNIDGQPAARNIRRRSTHGWNAVPRLPKRQSYAASQHRRIIRMLGHLSLLLVMMWPQHRLLVRFRFRLWPRLSPGASPRRRWRQRIGRLGRNGRHRHRGAAFSRMRLLPRGQAWLLWEKIASYRCASALSPWAGASPRLRSRLNQTQTTSSTASTSFEGSSASWASCFLATLRWSILRCELITKFCAIFKRSGPGAGHLRWTKFRITCP